MASDDRETSFDTSGFDRISQGFASLGSNLPESALEVIAREVIARLANGRARMRDSERKIDAALVQTICSALIGPNQKAAVDMITDLRDDGKCVEEIYLGVLTPAARELGTWWDQDRATFSEVAIGVARIYGIMYGLRSDFPMAMSPHGKTAAFASVPGDTHTLGVSMAADLFRKEGWDIDLKLGLDHDALVQSLGSSDAPIIGLSAGQEESLPALIRLVVALRVSNPRAYVMIAGRFASKHADTLALTGADAAASNMEEAHEAMERLWKKTLPDAMPQRAH